MLVGGNDLDHLLDALLVVPGLNDSDVRDAHAAELEQVLPRSVGATRFADARHDLSSLVNTCAAYSGGLRTLAAIVYRRHPDEAAARVVAMVDDIVGPVLLSPADRDELRQHLAGIAVEQVADAVSELVEAAELRSLQTWRDVLAAIRMMERLPLPDDDVPQLVTFADRLALVVGGTKGGDLRRWVDMVAGGLGVDAAALTQLRAASAAGGRRSAPPIGLAGDGRPSQSRRAEEAALIWGGVPIRNRNFTGRVALLDRLGEALRSSSKASVLPQTLHGMGGVGKTQLVIEYVYSHLDQYELVWWIAAEQTASVLASLTQLAERLGLPTTEDRQQAARTVLDALAGGELSWLLVYDNAGDPATLDQFVPSTGGHVILTTRNQEWSTIGATIEVDVFERAESVELLRKRSLDGSGGLRFHADEADELADKLGDLPLALEQAAAWCLTTAMPVTEYIELLDSHIKDLLSEGKPASYPLTVAAFVSVAVQRLYEAAPATAQMFELFAYLGGEPVAVSLLRYGKDAAVVEPLRGMLSASIPLNRAIRDLSRYGLAKVDAVQRVQVHRLVQRVLRDSFPPERARQTLRNAQNLLAAANPGDPDEHGEPQRHRDMGPHIEPADLIHAENLDARQAVLDHARHLYNTGDYENSLRLALRAGDAWERDTSHARLGPDGELTLVARAQFANATRTLGESAVAAPIARTAYDRLRRNPAIGPRHELTLITGNQIGYDLRIAGRFREALEFDIESVTLHREVFGPGETYTLRAQANLAVDHRMVGNFAEAFALDADIAGRWEDVGGTDPRALAAYINMARDYYGMGAYRAGLDVLERWMSPLQENLGPGHSQVLLAGRTYAITLRKAGRLVAAHEVIQENQERVQKRFGPNHEFSIATGVSHANILRELGALDEARRQLADAIGRYEAHFGPSHPLTLVARVNDAHVLRARGDLATARNIDAQCFRSLAELLTPDHPYTLCAGAALATDLAFAHEPESAAQLSTRILELSRAAAGRGHEARDGAEHPYLLMRAVNLSHDLRTTGALDAADALYTESVVGLRAALGSDHPDVLAVGQGQRTEGDIEAPPT